MDEVRIFVSNNTATFVCPECTKSRTANVANIIKSKSQVRINCKCKCGHTFKALLERRKFFRKDIELPGTFHSERDGKKTFTTVVDVSRSGCKLKINPEINTFRVGDTVIIEFRLDDSSRSSIQKKATIKTNEGTFLGVQFSSIEEFDKLGHYLMFK